MKKKVISTILASLMIITTLDGGILTYAAEDFNEFTSSISEKFKKNDIESVNETDSENKLGAIRDSEEDLKDAIKINSPEDLKRVKNSYNSPYGLCTFAMDKAGEQSDEVDWSKVPSSSDNSKSPYFPKITNQSGGSCVPNSIAYYQLTYMVNRELNRPISGNNYNVMAPEFLYNLVNNSGGNSGTHASSIYNLIKKYGCASRGYTLAEYGKTIDGDNFYVSCYPKEEIWSDAQQYKISDYYTIQLGSYYNKVPITSNHDDDLYTVKKLLSDGEIFSFSTDIYYWRYDTIPQGSSHAGEKIMPRADVKHTGDGGHEMTVVGYDDNIYIDINDDGVIQDGERGAFKIANSWDDDWQNDGFVWLSYDAINEVSSVNNSKISSDNRIGAFDSYHLYGMIPNVKSNDSGVYLSLSLNTNNRRNFTVNISDPEGNNTINIPILGWGGSVNLNGTEGYESGTVLIDLKNIYEDVTIDDIYNRGFKISFTDNSGFVGGGSEIDNIKIIDKKNNKIYDSFISAPINVYANTIDVYTNNKSLLPPSNLRTSNNGNLISLSWDKMESENNVSGYMVYRNDTLIGKTTDTSFNDNIYLNDEYTYKVVAYDSSHMCSNPATVKIGQKTENNICKVYYKTSNAKENIHFKIGNNSWTAVPGVSMKKSATKAGYYEYDIDLSNYDKDTVVTACFNNGTVWDNNSNRDYILRKGINIVENGQVSYSSSLFNKLTINNIVINNDKIKINELTKFSADITGGSGNYNTVYNITGPEDVTINGYSNTSATWIPKVQGSYKIKCTVTDKNTGEVVTSSKDIIVDNVSFDIENVKITAADPNKVSVPTEISFSVNNNVADLSADIEILLDGSEYSSQGLYRLYDSKGIFSTYFTPKKCGIYTLNIKVTDRISGYCAKKSLEYRVEQSELSVCSFKAQKGYNEEVQSIRLGESASFSSLVSGGTPEYSYTIGYKKDNGEYVKVKDNEPYDYYYFKPEETGEYEFIIEVKDANNNVATKSTKLQVLNGEFAINKYDCNVTGSISNADANVNLILDSVYGVGQVKYKVTAKDNYGYEFVVQDYSNNSNINWKPEVGGGYYFVIDAIDEAGNTASKGDVYFYLQPEPIDIQFTSDKSEINYGDDVTLNYSASGGAGAFKYNLYAYDENGSRYTLVENTSEKTFKWTSNLEGKVRFEINAVDSKNSIETKSLDINVLKLNKTFIYYKGYDNPNIHYKVGNGAWTVVPGVKMVRTSDVEGYPYMAEIDLGDSKTLTACFNNGNGVWDNNGGKDYTFEAGYYTICNGVINKINKPNSGIKINELTSKLGNTYAQGNENIFETKILNAVGDVQYKYSYINNVTGDACIIRDFSKYNNLAWKYYKPGNYTITVEVKDSNGNTATKSIEINITE